MYISQKYNRQSKIIYNHSYSYKAGKLETSNDGGICMYVYVYMYIQGLHTQ